MIPDTTSPEPSRPADWAILAFVKEMRMMQYKKDINHWHKNMLQYTR